jgi:predicted dehydrogenase
MSGKPLRLGMVGGGPGAFFGAVHRAAARLDGEFELVAGAFSSRPEGVAQSGALLADPSRSYASHTAMIAAESARADGVQLVSVVTPNHLHYPVARDCLQAGISVLCEKPLTLNSAEARHLAVLAAEKGLHFAVAYTYTGYPMVREARALVQSGALGRIRGAQIRYAQDWLAARIEDEGQKQASWRVDPALAGPGGCLGDIGTHCFNMLRGITGLKVLSLSAELRHLVPGRRLDDEIQIALRLEDGATAGIWASQVALGEEKNGLTLHIYGDKGGLFWAQENPDWLHFTPLDEPTRLIRRGSGKLSDAATRATRLPGGHPEGYFEALGQIYRDLAAQMRGETASPPFGASVQDGVEGVAFVEIAVASAAQGGAWAAFPGGEGKS